MCVHIHIIIVVDPVPCGEVLRMAFIRMNWLKYAVTFLRVAGFRGNTVATAADSEAFQVSTNPAELAHSSLLPTSTVPLAADIRQAGMEL